MKRMELVELPGFERQSDVGYHDDKIVMRIVVEYCPGTLAKHEVADLLDQFLKETEEYLKACDNIGEKP